MSFKLSDHKDADEDYAGYAWPGGYPVYYITPDGGIFCPNCVNENKELCEQEDDGSMEVLQWRIIGAKINEEDLELKCDNCYCYIECGGEDNPPTHHALACPAQPVCPPSTEKCTCKRDN